MNLLIVDDNEQNRYFLKTLLNAHGHKVVSLANGEEALILAHNSPPDLIITDILMPVMDGYSLCREWKKDERLKQIPLIFYSATYTDPQDIEFALKLGATRFVVKPAEPDAFMALIDEVMDQFITGRLTIDDRMPESEEVYLKEYNQTLIRKLENKLTQLQSMNEQLEDEVARRKEKEEESERLTTAIEHTAEVVIITDIEGIILYVNPAFERITGYTRKEALGENPRILKSSKQDNAFYKEMWDVLVRGEIWTGRIINKRKNGTLYTSETSISPIKNDDGSIINYVAIAADITVDLAREELARHNQKMESIGRLTGGVAHDFNNILQVIKGFGTILTEGIDNCVTGKSVDYNDLQICTKEILKSANLAQQLIQQLLSFSQKKQKEYKVANLNTIISSGEQILRQALEANMNLELMLDPQLEPVIVDDSQMLQIAINLIVNARDAMPDGGRVTLSTHNITLTEDNFPDLLHSSDESFVCLSISDNGCGMDESQIEHLFEPFYTTKERGTGLGLSVVYEIVQEHGGTIDVSSTPGQGTEFRVILPVQDPKIVALSSIQMETNKEQRS